MNSESQAPFIFYLTLEENLPSTFYTFNHIFKDLGFMLLPVRMDQLQTLVSSSDQNQFVVITSISSFKEFKLYNEKVRGLLKFLMKCKRLTFMQLSSFSKLDDSKLFSFYKNYYFLKYPVDAQLLAGKIARYYDLKSEQNSRWPGGRRPGTLSGGAT